MKRALGIILAAVVLIAVCGGIAAASILGQAGQDYGEFVPVVRFAVASDTHVDDKGTELFEQRLEKLFSSAYAYAGSQQYSALDGVFITGDFTDNGTLRSMQKVFRIIEENAKDGTVCRVTLGNHDFYTDKESSLDTFLEASEYETVNAHFTLKGFHFICINPDIDGLNFSEDTVSWLDEQLAQAAAEDPTGEKPIFVFQHEPAYDTVVHSLKLGVEELNPVLEKYPQVVDFSGHTHCPTSDPRNIWQGAFTAVGVGPLCHYEYTIASQEEEISGHTNYEGDYGIWPSVNDASQYYIVEVDADNAVRLLRYDVDTDRLLEDPVILTNIGHAGWPLPEFLQKLLSEQPVFAEDAKAEAVFTTSSSVQVRFPQAQCGDTVHYYSVELYQDGEEVDFHYRMACSFLDKSPKTLTATFIDLEPDTQYTVKIFARNPWGKESEPCVLDFRTEAAVSSDSDADVLDMKLQGEDIAFNAVTGEIFSRVGQPKVELDPELGYEVLVLDGKSGYLMDGFADFYDRLTTGVSLEVYLKLENTVSKTENNWVSPLSNLQRSGVGMEISFHGHPSFQCFINDDYGIAEAPEPIPVGEYIHIVGTYDGAYVRLYVNGREVASDHRPGGVSYGISGHESADYMGIGMDADPARMAQSCITGRLAVARVYSSVLTPEQVQQRFAACAGIGEE